MQEERAKILMVDDEKAYLDVLGGLLRPYYRTIAAKDGEQALQRLKTQPLPDLILLDVTMPGMNGYEVCRAIKDNRVTKDIPIIFITGNSGTEDETRCFEAGAVDYVAKPFRPTVVLARIKNHMELKRRGDMLERLAILDGLTGIPNRRRFDHVISYEWERSLRYQHVLTLIMMDIDFFKLYNDHYGHAGGDTCLKKVAGAISAAMPRTIDLAARYGGEEFACILPETSGKGALAVAERILARVRDLQIPHAQSRVADHVTVSIGVTTMVPNMGQSFPDLIKRADEALYQAKHDGRNRVVAG
ncbi:MAG: diguanylate cyclase [Magnetococcales bacterium]|nr:diguanylate cyclase [Magnetococcales bacterium]